MGEPMINREGFTIKCDKCGSESPSFRYGNDEKIEVYCSLCGNDAAEYNDYEDDNYEVDEFDEFDELIILGLDNNRKAILEHVEWDGSNKIGNYEVDATIYNNYIEGDSSLDNLNKGVHKIILFKADNVNIRVVFIEGIGRGLAINDTLIMDNKIYIECDFKTPIVTVTYNLSLEEAKEWLKNNRWK